PPTATDIPTNTLTSIPANTATFNATNTPVPPTATSISSPTSTNVVAFTSTSTTTLTPGVCTIIYVTPSGNDSSSGCSWTAAKRTVQGALAIVTSGSEVWVAAGTYYPDEGSGQVNNDRDSTFQMANNVSVYGGFVGGETVRGQRNSNPNTNNTVLS